MKANVQEQAEHTQRENGNHYRELFESMDHGYCVIEMLFDANGKPDDFLFVEVNAAFIQMTGWPQAIGMRMRELAPNHEAHWFETLGRVTLSGEPIRFIQKADALDARWFDVYAFRLGGPTSRTLGVMFTDVTESKQAKEALAVARSELSEIIELAPSFMCVLRGP